MFRSFQVSLILFISLVSIFSAHSAEEWFDDLDAYIIKGMENNKIPGLAIAIVKDDQIIFIKGYGVRELGKNEPVDENTIFPIGSNTKAFTALAVGMLVERGKVEWDKPVIDYLQDFRMYDPWVTRELTVRDSLSNRNGLGEESELLWYRSTYDRNELIHRIRYVKPDFSLRSKYAYRNLMFLVAGQIIPAVTNMSWDDFVKKNIFNPLGMKRSYTSVRELAGLDNLALPHSKIQNEVTPIPYCNIDNIAPAGSINSTAHDMAQWVRLQLSNGTFDSKPVVKEEILKETHNPNIFMPLDEFQKLIPQTHFLGYCMGWATQDYHGYQLWWHGGSIDGTKSNVGLIPEKNYGLVILTNLKEQEFPQAIFNYWVDLVLELPTTDWETTLREIQKQTEDAIAERIKKNEELRKLGTNPSLPLNAYVGKYRNDLNEIIITQEGDHLVMQFYDAFVGNLKHWQYDTFQVTWNLISSEIPAMDSRIGMGFITFSIDKDGKVKALQRDGLTPHLKVE